MTMPYRNKDIRMATAFEHVSLDEFNRALSQCAASQIFRKQFARFQPQYYEGHNGPDCMIHLGHLKMEGRFEAPGFFTLIAGNLDVDGIVDLHNPYDKGFDEGGLFVVLGDVTCNAFFNEYGKCSLIDGKLEARELLLNAFGDSALVVTGNLTTNFFYGQDMWAEVGGDVSMEYGEGYCLPIGYADAVRDARQPKRDLDTSLMQLNLAKTEDLYPADFRDHLLAGKPLLKR
jgi:hypothetical protein